MFSAEVSPRATSIVSSDLGSGRPGCGTYLAPTHCFSAESVLLCVALEHSSEGALLDAGSYNHDSWRANRIVQPGEGMARRTRHSQLASVSDQDAL
jgi:hypothetical protein